MLHTEPHTENGRSHLEQQALDFRQRAEQFRMFGELARSPAARSALRDLADTADQMAAKIEALVLANQARDGSKTG